MKRVAFSLLTVCLAYLPGCKSMEVWEHDFGPEPDVVEVVADVVVDGAETVALPSSGAPCTLDEQCYTQQCFTTEFIAGLLGKDTIKIPNGMCSKFGCDDSVDAATECGPGAYCLDATSLTGGTAIKLCVLLCTDSTACRYSDSYGCFDTGVKDKDTKPVLACLPASLVVALKCGDKICDANEKADPTLCPEDCK